MRNARHALHGWIILLAACTLGCGGRPEPLQPSIRSAVYGVEARKNRDRTAEYQRNGLLNAADEGTVFMPDKTPRGDGIATKLTGTQLTLGAVVADVNGTPIYAHELVSEVLPALRPRARQLTEPGFRRLVTEELTRQRDIRIQDELVFAAAERNVTLEERRTAELLTSRRFEKLVTAAGGSRELARRRVAEQGDDWDRMLRDEYRRNLVGIYYTKKVLPRAQSSVDEMRKFYERERATRFTEPATSTFVLIRIDPKQAGDANVARQQIEQARTRLLGGEDAQAVADEFNTADFLRERHGVLGPITKDTFAFPKVEAAVWETAAGQITPVIEERGYLFIAKVIEKMPEKVRPFEDPAVQDQIIRALREMKMSELQRKEAQILRSEAIINADPAMLAPAIDMAMQQYAAWRREANE